MQPLPVRHIFVYGTLCRGEERDINLLSPAPQAVGRGITRGVLYDLGSYPGMQLAGQGCNEVVHGEVYSITAELEKLLDQIEEVWPQQTGEYTKREVLVRVACASSLNGYPPHVNLTCLVYAVSPLRTIGKSAITSGDWVHHRLHKVF